MKQLKLEATENFRPFNYIQNFDSLANINAAFNVKVGVVDFSEGAGLNIITDNDQALQGSRLISLSKAIRNDLVVPIAIVNGVLVQCNRVKFESDQQASFFNFNISVFSDKGAFILRPNTARTHFEINHPYLEDRTTTLTSLPFSNFEEQNLSFLFEDNSLVFLYSGKVKAVIKGIEQPTRYEGIAFELENDNQDAKYCNIFCESVQVRTISNTAFNSLIDVPPILKSFLERDGNGFLMKVGDAVEEINLPISVQAVPTTQGQAFSRSFNSIQLEGAEIVRKFPQERVLIIGSSNAAGAGASTYQNSWVGKLEAFLNAKGIITLNVSIGGTNTQSSLDRFFKDVLNFHPTIVVEATALWNEGLYAGNFDAVNTASKNFGKLKNLCEQAGIRLLKGPVLPYTGSLAGGNLSTDKVQSFNVFYANMLDSLLIGDGMSLAEGNHIFPAINSGDNIHVNDVGHQLVFDCLNPYLFTHPHLSHRVFFPLSEIGVKAVDNQNNIGDFKGLRLTFDADIRLKSFSIAFQVKWNPATQPITILGLVMDNPTRLRIRHNLNYLSLCGNGEGVGADVNTPINTLLPENLDKWHDIVVSFSSLRNKGKFFFNGTLIGEIDCPTREIKGINFLGNGLDPIYQAVNHSIKNIFVYRTCLDDNTAKNFFKGIRPKRSLILASPMNEVIPTGGKFTNYACSPLAIQNNFVETSLV